MKFSVLISAYHTEIPANLERALKSIWDDQILKPDEIVLVKDGQLTKDLDFLIEVWSKRLHDIIKVIELEKNVGLGNALGIGIKECKHDVIARMDTDDISLPHRFLTQISYLQKNKNIQLLGAHISEFEFSETNILRSRQVPLTHENILRKSKFSNPFNHPVVVYRKTAVLNAGGPMNFTDFDDYFLWIRMLMNGYKTANIDDVLLLMRTGNGLIKRRSGLKYANQEWKFQNKLLKIGFINYFVFGLNLIRRIPIRLFPSRIIKIVYKLILRK